MKILLIYGGMSPEHEVSLRSAQTVYAGLVEAGHAVQLAYVTKTGDWKLASAANQTDGPALNYDESSKTWQANKKHFLVDVAFPLIHGVTGEDGRLQTYLEQTNTPYVGCNAAVSKLCFDKFATKRRLAEHGIAVSPEVLVKKELTPPSYEDLTAKLGNVLFVKPTRSGSSIGVHKVESDEQFMHALTDAFKYDEVVLVESAVHEPREFEVSVLEDEQGNLNASGVGEIIPGETFYSYDDKYAAGSAARVELQPELADSLNELICKTARQTAKVLGCQGLVRVDFLYATREDKLYVNEVNTLPGFTSISMYPKLWEVAGMNLAKLCDQLVRVAVLQAK